jgi:hypothetical protein
MEREEIIWLKCPSCDSKIGIILPIGKTQRKGVVSEDWPPQDIERRLEMTGVDPNLLDIEMGEDIIIISPKKFLGDLWSQINEAIRDLGGKWVRAGRESHWELERS